MHGLDGIGALIAHKTFLVAVAVAVACGLAALLFVAMGVSLIASDVGAAIVGLVLVAPSGLRALLAVRAWRRGSFQGRSGGASELQGPLSGAPGMPASSLLNLSVGSHPLGTMPPEDQRLVIVTPPRRLPDKMDP